MTPDEGPRFDPQPDAVPPPKPPAHEPLASLEADIDLLLHSTWSYALQTRSLPYNRTQLLNLGRRAHMLTSFSFFRGRRSASPPLEAEADVTTLKGKLAEVVRDLTMLQNPYTWHPRTAPSAPCRITSVTRLNKQASYFLWWHFEMAVHRVLTLRNVLNSRSLSRSTTQAPDDTAHLARPRSHFTHVRAVILCGVEL
ncbi:hypothetical protein BC830DRAFT_1168213 [Chytriomyces sp. MP71]|nr:hypothetical protein BC830DRAFT_1168213 [Chytriomyces sp. MP71]